MMGKDHSNEFEYYAADDDFVLIRDGEYHAECVDYKDQGYDSTKRKLYLKFELFMDESEIDGGGIVSLYKCFNIPLNSRVGPRSDYYNAWKMVHGKEPFDKRTQLHPRVFKNKFYKVSTRTVKTFRDKTPRPENKQYSVVDKILLFVRK